MTGCHRFLKSYKIDIITNDFCTHIGRKTGLKNIITNHKIKPKLTCVVVAGAVVGVVVTVNRNYKLKP